ncbi:MAG: hypothetical protein U0X76_12320 [Bacteroidia bacterium]
MVHFSISEIRRESFPFTLASVYLESEFSLIRDRKNSKTKTYLRHLLAFTKTEDRKWYREEDQLKIGKRISFGKKKFKQTLSLSLSAALPISFSATKKAIPREEFDENKWLLPVIINLSPNLTLDINSMSSIELGITPAKIKVDTDPLTPSRISHPIARINKIHCFAQSQIQLLSDIDINLNKNLKWRNQSQIEIPLADFNQSIATLITDSSINSLLYFRFNLNTSIEIKPDFSRKTYLVNTVMI